MVYIYIIDLLIILLIFMAEVGVKERGWTMRDRSW
jgi:hypothetical protein